MKARIIHLTWMFIVLSVARLTIPQIESGKICKDPKCYCHGVAIESTNFKLTTVCLENEGCHTINGEPVCLKNVITIGDKCTSREGCMCAFNKESPTGFTDRCLFGDTCDNASGSLTCALKAIKAEVACTDGPCMCFGGSGSFPVSPARCQTGEYCGKLGNGFYVAVKSIVEVNQPCAEGPCLCKTARQQGKPENVLLKTGESCANSGGPIVYGKKVGMWQQCPDNVCLCEDGGNTVWLFKNEVCGRQNTGATLKAYQIVIKPGKLCSIDSSLYCACITASGPSAGILVAKDNYCAMDNTGLVSTDLPQIFPNSFCGNGKGCWCRSPVKEKEYIVCSENEACMITPNGYTPGCFTVRYEALATGSGDFKCRAVNGFNDINCSGSKKQQCATGFAHFCATQIINVGQQCTDTQGCICQGTGEFGGYHRTRCRNNDYCAVLSGWKIAYCVSAFLKDGGTKPETFGCGVPSDTATARACPANSVCVTKKNQINFCEKSGFAESGLCRDPNKCICLTKDEKYATAFCSAGEFCFNSYGEPTCYTKMISAGATCTMKTKCVCHLPHPDRYPIDGTVIPPVVCEENEQCVVGNGGLKCLKPFGQGNTGNKIEKYAAKFLEKSEANGRPNIYIDCGNSMILQDHAARGVRCVEPDKRQKIKEKEVCLHMKKGCTCYDQSESKNVVCSAGEVCSKGGNNAPVCKKGTYDFWICNPGDECYCATTSTPSTLKFCLIGSPSSLSDTVPDTAVVEFTQQERNQLAEDAIQNGTLKYVARRDRLLSGISFDRGTI